VNGKKEQRNHYKRARDHASNAYILDTREENVTDVNYVRGEAFRLLGKHKKAVENYERAFEAVEAGVPSDMRGEPPIPTSASTTAMLPSSSA